MSLIPPLTLPELQLNFNKLTVFTAFKQFHAALSQAIEMSEYEKRRRGLMSVLADVQCIGSDIDDLRHSYGDIGQELRSRELRALLLDEEKEEGQGQGARGAGPPVRRPQYSKSAKARRKPPPWQD